MKKYLITVRKCLSLFHNKHLLLLSFVLRGLNILLAFISPLLFSKILSALSFQDTLLAHKCTLFYIGSLFLLIATNAIIFFIDINVEKNNRVNIKKKLLMHLFSLHPATTEISNSAKLTEIFYSDVNNITAMIYSVWSVFADICTTLSAGVILFFLNKSITLIISFLCVLTAIFYKKYAIVLRQVNIDLRKRTDNNFKIVRDILYNIASIQIGNSNDYFTNLFSLDANYVLNSTIKRDKTAWLINFISNLTEKIATIIFLLVGINMISSHSIELSNYIFFLSCSKLFCNSTIRLMKIPATFQQQYVSVERVLDLFNLSDSQCDSEKLVEVNKISLENVSFSYDSSYVIQNFSFSFEKNKLYLICGPNGSGKSTMMNLISGIFPPTLGRISYDGRSTSSIYYKEISQTISYCSQYEIVYDISIRDNLLLFNNGSLIPQKQMEEVCEAFLLLKDITSLPHGFDTILSDTYKLSAGQKKKILLVRNYLKPSSVILLDEPLAGIDRDSRKRIAAAINRMRTNKITIISTHFIEDFDACDDVIHL